MRMRMAIASLALGLTAGTAPGAYVISALSDGNESVTVDPGGAGASFDLDVLLTSDGGDEHNSTIFRLAFSEPGLRYDDYLWAPPYETGSIYDDSDPFLSELGGGLILDADALSGTGYPDDVVDIELSNIVPIGEPYFGEGMLVTLSLFVPPSFPVPQTVLISLEPDTIANGFLEIPTTAGSVFELTIVPEPSTMIMILAAVVALPRRRSARTSRDKGRQA